MPEIKEVRCKPRVHVSLNLEYGHHLARLRRRHGYVPTSNAASPENHEKINRWDSLTPDIGMGLRLAALRVAGAPL